VRTESWEALAWPGFGAGYQVMDIQVLQKKRHFRMSIGAFVLYICKHMYIKCTTGTRDLHACQIRVPASDNYTSAKQITNFASVIFSIKLLRVRSENCADAGVKHIEMYTSLFANLKPPLLQPSEEALPRNQLNSPQPHVL
jgi:hypothetical protein